MEFFPFLPIKMWLKWSYMNKTVEIWCGNLGNKKDCHLSNSMIDYK